MEFPIGKKYQIIYADPPWSYRVHVTDNNKNRINSGWRNAAHFYQTMTTDEIKNLPINSITDKNCILFMWVTNPLLPEGFEVIKSWGFEYKTIAFVWMKTYRKGNIFCGIGHYTRGIAELCLITTKGSIKIFQFKRMLVTVLFSFDLKNASPIPINAICLNRYTSVLPLYIL